MTLRAQYHLRDSPDGLLAWDVRRLVRLAGALPVEAVPLAAIRELDEPYWFDLEGDAATVRAVLEHARLIAEADLSYPILLSADGRVMDGMHRVAKAVLEGRSHVEARRFPETPPPDHVGADPDALPYDD